jgi:hypothetical protein
VEDSFGGFNVGRLDVGLAVESIVGEERKVGDDAGASIGLDVGLTAGIGVRTEVIDGTGTGVESEKGFGIE